MEHVATTSTSRNNVDSGCTRDYTSEFFTTETFNSKEELIIWAKNVGKENGITIVVLRSDSGKGKKKPRVTLGCERSGKCDRRNSSPQKSKTVESKRRRTGTKKCDCPFRLRGEKLAAGNEWELTVDVGIHNHAAERPERGNSFQGRLCQEEKSVVKDRYKRGEKPKQILKALKERDKHNKSTERTIYNELRSLKDRATVKDELEDQSFVLRQLMSKVGEYDYIEKHRTTPTIDINVLDFFLTHRTSIELLRAFPTVLRIYLNRENRFTDVPTWERVEFSGVTSTNMMFYVASAILCPLQGCSFEWALNSLRGVMDDNGIVRPDIVIFDTDMDTLILGNETLDRSHLDPTIKAINNVFGTAKLLFSTDCIRCSVVAGGKWHGGSQFSLDTRWELLKESPTEAVFELHLNDLKQLCTELGVYPEPVKYVIDTFVQPQKEKFIAAWTDKVMHFGNTKRAISCYYGTWTWPSHYILEFYLFYYYGRVLVKQTEIDTCLKDMHSYNEKTRLEIDDSFLESLVNKYTNGEDGLKELHGAISIYALNMIREQTKLANEIDDDHSECGYAIKRTHGLPCAHEIAKYKREGRPIPLECINSYWKKLPRLKPLRRTGEPNVYETLKRPRLSEEMNTNAHSSLSLPGTVESERNSPNACLSRQESQPGDEVYDIQPTTQFEFGDVCQHLLGSYIRDVKDVLGDGHCGFRAIASFMGYGEDSGWVKVRNDLRNELMLYSAYYELLLGDRSVVNELLHRLKYDEIPCPEEHWMRIPDMGHVIASYYNVVLVHLSSDQCFTFFPLRTYPFSTSPPKEIVIGFVRGHFVQVYLEAGHPMPPPPARTKKYHDVASDWWEEFHLQRSTEWANLYSGRLEYFKSSSQPEIVSQKNPIVLD
ncbi:uncharacterized protein LOC112175749 [Rosa chinensis]|uniref:uncharacterized protein LOC112175749 n=1 Tax=Rosa chinensis TaxID=74649 RepID=UPI000D09745D|nr:uncharacterized protein LOC112175749 [Rosa chinensis]XP_024169253.1 uncharacterized protein LOC112175749 [Rosa chinensis]